MIKITACIITLNEAHVIKACLDKLTWCDEIVVLDSGSTDDTLAICEASGCKVSFRKFDAYSTQRQFAMNLAKNDWILSIDADEQLSTDLINELKNLCNTDVLKHVAYNIRFKTYYLGRILNSCGLGDEKHIRFFNRTKVKYANTSVHEYLEIDGSTDLLKAPIFHFSYTDLHEHLYKINQYTSMWSNDRALAGKKTSIFKVVMQFPVKFFLYYIVRYGFISGYRGFVFSLMHAIYSSMKYAKLLEKQK